MARPSAAAAALLGILGLLAAACADEPRREATYGGTRAGACAAERNPPEQSGGHLLGDATPPAPYSSRPPTSGWHSAGAPRFGAHGPEDPLREPEQVTVLELGGVVLAWNGLGDAERDELEAAAARHPGVVATTPYEHLEPGQVAMTAWGVLAVCEGVDNEAIDAFVAAHEGGGPPH